MRVSNRKRNPRCGCEHVDHFDVDGHNPRTAHRYQQGTADGGWALYVGHVCKACEDHMESWIVGEHVCGEGDCHRGDGDGEAGAVRDVTRVAEG